MKMTTRGWCYSAQWPQKSRICKQQGRRNVTVLNKLPRPVDVTQKQIEQVRPLRDSCLDDTPFVRRDKQRYGIDCQWPVYTLRVGVNVVGNAVLADSTFRALPAARQFVGPDLLERFDDR